MISIELARALRTAGLRWHPRSGDSFVIETSESTGDVFTVSEMTVEVHDFPSGQLIGFNGTTEWALDSVDVTDTLWLPREDQLREILRDGFRTLDVDRSGGEPLYLVTASVRGEVRTFEALTVADAYGEAVLDLIVQSLVTDGE
ncbi:pilus assembly protein CpaE [Herbiconiux daphne]|uniref:Pilus assembly protein CpaE n=1 Tax=Herbiconiux daphne TaxID=2970914 RepID=A0ABT2H0T1_9MICO|nr:pilus assembly protein CpaE [Herbiconiux daphne]MCS5733543.1 pilus assembly protein CpaE [Herbiconiux daphne]